MWKSTLMEAAERGCCGFIDITDVDDVMSDVSSNKPDITLANKPLWGSKGSYSFQPYAYPRDSLSDWERVICKATLECYQKHFNLKVGVYVQGRFAAYLKQFTLLLSYSIYSQQFYFVLRQSFL